MFRKEGIIFLFLFLSFIVAHSQHVIRIESPQATEFLKNKNIYIIDGRTNEMYQSGHIKHAEQIDAFDTNVRHKLKELLNKDTLFIYCSNQRRSETIISILGELNYGGVIIYMTDGITGWKRNGFELTKVKSEKMNFLRRIIECCK
jgi:rhodanese-related sulfurtransferase